jgi:hypothetical protein
VLKSSALGRIDRYNRQNWSLDEIAKPPATETKKPWLGQLRAATQAKASFWQASARMLLNPA